MGSGWFKTTTNKCKTTMNQAPVRPQRGLVPFSNEAKEPFFSSTWDEFDQMRNQMMEKNHGFWDKVDQDMKEFEKCVSQMEADMDSANAPLRPSVRSCEVGDDRVKMGSGARSRQVQTGGSEGGSSR